MNYDDSWWIWPFRFLLSLYGDYNLEEWNQLKQRMLVIMKGGRQEVSPINRNAPLHATPPYLVRLLVLLVLFVLCDLLWIIEPSTWQGICDETNKTQTRWDMKNLKRVLNCLNSVSSLHPIWRFNSLGWWCSDDGNSEWWCFTIFAILGFNVNHFFGFWMRVRRLDYEFLFLDKN